MNPVTDTIEIIEGKGELIHATMSDITGIHKVFYFRERMTIQRLERKMPEDYPNYFHLKDGEKLKFRESCREDWKWCTSFLKTKLKQNNLFI